MNRVSPDGGTDEHAGGRGGSRLRGSAYRLRQPLPHPTPRQARANGDRARLWRAVAGHERAAS